MTMSEFNIRFFAYKRLEQIERNKVFELNRIIIGSSLTDKKVKTDLFNSTKKVLIGVSKPKINERALDVFRKQVKEYQNRKKK